MEQSYKEHLREESQTTLISPVSFKVLEDQAVQRLLLVQCVLGQT